jgi:hypothetical protein
MGELAHRRKGERAKGASLAHSPVRPFAVFAVSPVRSFGLTWRAEFFALPTLSAVVAPDEVKYSAGLCTDGSELPPLFHRVSWLF